MKLNKLSVFILLLPGLLIAGCSSAVEPVKNTSAANANTAIPVVNANQAVANVEIPANTAGNVNAGEPGGPLDAANRKRLVDNPAAGPPPPLHFEAAKESSEIASTMLPDGKVFEVRVFKVDPQIAKVELTWATATEKDVKVYLHDGKTLAAKTNTIPNLKLATLQQIRDLVGLKLPPPPPERVRPANSLKKGEPE